MSKKYLDETGLSHFWEKIKAKITSDISAETGKMIPYGYCTTAAKTVAKVVTVEPAITELTTGLTIAVKFEYANGVANPTLNVNGTGAKAIKRYGTTAPTTSAASSWNANSVIILTYDGTYWQIDDWNNTTYSTISDAEYQAGTSTSARLITPARLKAAIEHWADKNVNADWNATSGDAQILNKPTIPTVPTNVSEFTNDAGYITGYTETDPVFSASAAAGITSTDISNWNAKVSDDKTWNGVTLDKSGAIGSSSDYFTIYATGTGPASAKFITVTSTPTEYKIPKYDGDKYLYSTTPGATDNSTKVATTEFVKSVMPTVLEPLIGSTSEITPAQVKTALQEGRDICIQKAGIFEGINLDLRFTSWNSATDTDYSGQAMDVVVSQTIARYGGVYYLFELVGLIGGSWTLLNTTLAQKSDIPTVPTNVSEFTNDVGYITLSQAPTSNVFIATYGTTTLSEVQTEYYAGKLIFCKNENRIAGLTRADSGYFYFQFFNLLTTKTYILTANGWDDSQGYDVVTTGRKINNKSLSANVNLTASDVGALPDTTAIPTKTSDLTNDSGFIAEETDPTVPAWAKASTKPSYTASEVGALASTGGQVTGDITLYVASGNSPGIIFQRGTLTDNYNDWKIYDKSGFLYFAQRGSGSSAFGDVGYIDTGGVLRNFTIPWGSVSGKPTFATVATSGSYNDLSDKPTIPEGLPSVTTADNGKVLRVVNGEWTAVSLPSASGVSF